MLEITSLWGGALVVGFGLTSLSVGLYRAGNNIMYGSGVFRLFGSHTFVKKHAIM